MHDTENLKKQLEIVERVANAIAAMDNVKALANLILGLAVDYTQAEKGSLMLLNERGELVILAAEGIHSHVMDAYKAKIGEGIAGQVARHRRAVHVENIEKERQPEGMKGGYKTGAFVSCPISRKGKLLGILNVSDKRDGSPFTKDEFALLKILANQSAAAFENAFLMKELRLQAARSGERHKRLSELDRMKTEFVNRISRETRPSQPPAHPVANGKNSMTLFRWKSIIWSQRSRTFWAF
jgi:GAF domain-containing protein